MLSRESDVCAGKRSVAKPVVLACSGCSDFGEIADRAARILHGCRLAKMLCLALVGRRCSETVGELQAASRVLMIDGCDQECGKQMLQASDVDDFVQLRVVDLGCEKHRTPVTDERVMRVAREGRRLLEP